MRNLIVGAIVVLLIMSTFACSSSTTPTAASISASSAPATSQPPTVAPSSPSSTTTATISSTGLLVTPTEAPSPTATSETAAAPTATPESAIVPSATTAQTNVLDVHALPLGDGKVSTSAESGYVFSCQTNFKQGGAQHSGSWIHGETWDLTQKISVEGNVTWPDAQFQISTDGDQRDIVGNGLPVDSETGIFPIQHSDPAYQTDTNPNSIQSQNISFSLPLYPSMADTPSCVPMGMIGVALNGVAIFNALDAAGRDAVAHETQDICDGHPQSDGIYHYHGPSPCMPGVNGNNELVGYALDGFGIYSKYDANGVEQTDADLDACHGTTSPVMWNGKMVNMYHYVLTQEYPYTLGCFRGTPVRVRAEIVNNQSGAFTWPGSSIDTGAADLPNRNMIS